MTPRWLADALVAFHLAFIVFVVAGGLLVLWRRGWAAVHLPALAWGTFTELTGTVCPLTPWEQALRKAAGEGYSGGFVEHYVVPLIYPPGLTPASQLLLGAGLLVLNAAIYAGAWLRWRGTPPKPAHLGGLE